MLNQLEDSDFQLGRETDKDFTFPSLHQIPTTEEEILEQLGIHSPTNMGDAEVGVQKVNFEVDDLTNEMSLTDMLPLAYDEAILQSFLNNNSLDLPLEQTVVQAGISPKHNTASQVSPVNTNFSTPQQLMHSARDLESNSNIARANNSNIRIQGISSTKVKEQPASSPQMLATQPLIYTPALDQNDCKSMEPVRKRPRKTLHYPAAKQEEQCYRQGKPSPTQSTSDDERDEVIDKNRKNAMQAKMNRERKKAYVAQLEKETKELRDENITVKTELQNLKEEKCSMQEEINYLQNVIANQSTLSTLLKNIGATSLSLTASFTKDRKREREEEQETAKKVKYQPPGGGVCLHVENKNVSLEFCSRCSQMAHGAPQSSS